MPGPYMAVRVIMVVVVVAVATVLVLRKWLALLLCSFLLETSAQVVLLAASFGFLLLLDSESFLPNSAAFATLLIWICANLGGYLIGTQSNVANHHYRHRVL